MKKLSSFFIFFYISYVTLAQTFVTSGSATKVRDNEFQLTPADYSQEGSVWYSKKIDLKDDFFIKAQVLLGYHEYGADGFNFVLQPLNTSVVGLSDPSIAVEFDTFSNFENFDPEEDHLAFVKNGNSVHDTENNPAYILDINIEDGKWHDVTFSWKASTHTLSVDFLSHSYTYTADIVNSIFKGSTYVYWGFTGRTGAVINDQRVRNIKSSFGITTVTLINADTDEDIKELMDGDTINLSSVASLNLNIRANTSSTSGSVVFQLNGKQTRIHTENIAPYTLYGNKQNDYSGWTPENGDYTLTATPYELKDGKGKKGTPLTIHFHVIYQVVDSLVLVNAETDQDIKTIKNGEVIDLSSLPTPKLNIRAVVQPAKVGSVVFNLNDKLTVKESYVPYAIGGDMQGNFRVWTLPVGKHTLTATPYELENGSGQKGQSYTVKFTVVDSGIARIGGADYQQSAGTDTGPAHVSLAAQPNPFTSSTIINFSVPQTGYTTVQLFNSTGVLLEHLYGAVAEAKVVNKLPLQSQELPSGMYMLRLTSGNQAQSFKLLLVR